MNLQVTSSAFTEGSAIPSKYTCDGQDVSPPLRWSGVPQGAKSLALICDDPDAPGGMWVHWVLYNIPVTVTELPEGVPTAESVLGSARQGVTDFRRVGYGGPCPPRGNPHRYFFKVYALGVELTLRPKATKQDVVEAMRDHVLAEGQLMGTYKRS